MKKVILWAFVQVQTFFDLRFKKVTLFYVSSVGTKNKKQGHTYNLKNSFINNSLNIRETMAIFNRIQKYILYFITLLNPKTKINNVIIFIKKKQK